MWRGASGGRRVCGQPQRGGFLVCFADEQRLRGSSLRGENVGARAVGLPGAQRTHRIDREKQQQRALCAELPAPGATAHHPEEHARRGARDGDLETN